MQLPSFGDDLHREGLSVPEACHVAGIGRTSLYAALSSGKLRARKLGRRIIIMRSDLDEFLTGLPTYSGLGAKVGGRP